MSAAGALRRLAGAPCASGPALGEEENAREKEAQPLCAHGVLVPLLEEAGERQRPGSAALPFWL
jgi:hypothetical protein